MRKRFADIVPGMSAGAGWRLVERAGQLGALGRALAAARAGEGRAVLVEGPPGIGKSRLLEAARELAGQSGMRVLSACGRVLESEFGLGVARQLFERALSDGGVPNRVLGGPAANAGPLLQGAVPAPGASGAAQDLVAAHSLYWLTVTLAEAEPLLLVVDDLHWSDEASTRFLAYLGHRLIELPVALVLASRAGERPSMLDGVAADPDATTLELTELSRLGVHELVSAQLPHAAEEVLDACARASGGNPLVVQEIVRTMRAEAWALDAADARRLDDVAADAVASTALARLRLLPAAAGRLARALAVLGGESPLRRVAALAELAMDDAVHAADSLIGAEVVTGVEPLVFVHSLVSNAVYDELPPVERSDVHLRAARLLAAELLEPEVVGVHLMSARSDGAEWVVDVLRDAAQAAGARGDQRARAEYLRRALREPPAPRDQSELLLALGQAEAALGCPDALTHLDQALQRAGDPRERATILMETGRALMTSGRMRDAAEMFRRGAGELAAATDGEPDEELALELEASRAVAALYGTVETAATFAAGGELSHEDRSPRTRGERSLLGLVTSAQILRGGDRAAALARARRLWDDGVVLKDRPFDSLTAYSPVFVATSAGDLEAALRMCGVALRDARERGSPMGYATVCYWRLIVEYRLGRLADAIADGQAVIDAAAQGWTVAPSGAAGLLAVCLLDRDERGAAAELLNRFSPDVTTAERATITRWYEAAAWVALAEGDARRAADMAMRCAPLHAAGGLVNPAVHDWRSPAALALARLGESTRARQVARENLSLARTFGEPRALGIALRTAGLVAAAEDRGPLLQQAVVTLRSSPAVLELSRTLLELGAVLRRDGAPRAAREPLREALGLAVDCQAWGLRRRALDELSASGARPRRTALSGPHALTPAERRVALLAADGLSNRQIAHSLFVTLKTVEKHMSNSYAKLGIHGRSALAGALVAEEKVGGVPTAKPTTVT